MTVRALRRDEPIPAGRPRRYRNGAGYVRLRWLVGTDEYVEEYEHRVVAGRPDGHVHHRNGDRADNRPENLEPQTGQEHAALHAALAWRTGPPWRVRRSLARRAAREARWYAMRVAYESGMSSIEVGQAFGIDASNVSRGLRARGVRLRWWCKP